MAGNRVFHYCSLGGLLIYACIVVCWLYTNIGLCIAAGVPVLRRGKVSLSNSVIGIAGNHEYYYVTDEGPPMNEHKRHFVEHRESRRNSWKRIIVYTVIPNVRWEQVAPPWDLKSSKENEGFYFTPDEQLWFRTHPIRATTESFMGLNENVLIIRFPTAELAGKIHDYFSALEQVYMVDFVRPLRGHRVDAARDITLTLATGLPSFATRIAIADTGLDLAHRCFAGPDHKTNFYLLTAARGAFLVRGQGELANLDDRDIKVESYYSLGFLRNHGEWIVTDFDDGPGGHGTHVAGIAGGRCLAAGAGTGSGLENPLSHILFFDVERQAPVGGAGAEADEDEEGLDVPYSYWWVLQEAYDRGARIFTNSWGSPGCNYTALAYEIDLFVSTHPDLVVIFSAGNMGPGLCTIGSPAVGKNVLAVGSHLNGKDSFQPSAGSAVDPEEVRKYAYRYRSDHLSAFSSRGPTADGRIKPEIVAPGEFLRSAYSGGPNHTETFWMRGTSQAAPAVALGLASIHGYLQRVQNVHPSAALIKAIMIVSSRPFPEPAMEAYTSSSFSAPGKYRIDLKPLHDLPIEARGFGYFDVSDFFNGKVSFHDNIKVTAEYSASLCFRVASTATGPLTIVMAYTDIPLIGSIGGKNGSIIVNDINLRVTDLSVGLTRFGNDAAEPGDPKNPIEVIRYPDAEPLRGHVFRVDLIAAGPVYAIVSSKRPLGGLSKRIQRKFMKDQEFQLVSLARSSALRDELIACG